jgi:methylglutaconyl-CoA hydratase
MALDADWRDAAWAERSGLYAAVKESIDEVDAAVLALSRRISASNPEAAGRIKQAIWSGTDHWQKLLDERAAMSGTLVLSEFTRKAIESFGSR